jgi:hypothetical protein
MCYSHCEIWGFHNAQYEGCSILVCVTSSLLDSTSISLEHWYYFSTRLYGITSQKFVIALTVYIVMNWDRISYIPSHAPWQLRKLW